MGGNGVFIQPAGNIDAASRVVGSEPLSVQERQCGAGAEAEKIQSYVPPLWSEVYLYPRIGI
jgi:hypothetical protein